MSSNKRSKRFLSLAKKAGGVKELKKGRKRLRKEENEDSMEEIELDGAISMQETTSAISAKKPKGSITRHRDELEGLKESDPDFYNYLQKHDSQMLEFGQGEDDDGEDDSTFFGNEDEENPDDEGDDLEETEDNEEHNADDEGFESAPSVEVSIELLQETIEGSLKGTLSAIKTMLAILRAACIPHGDDDDDDDDEDVGKKRNSYTRFTIKDAEVYNEVIVNILENAHKSFSVFLGIENVSSMQAAEALKSHPKWKKMQVLVLSFYKSVLHTLAGLAVSSRDGQVSAYLVNCLEDYIAFLAPMPRLAKGVLKVLLNLWSEGPASWEGDGTVNVRGYAFLRIRQMAVLLPGAMAEECFRSMYLTFARSCKTFNEMTIQSTAFMAESIETLYSLDIAHSYQQSFLYIRQLALHLRTAMLKKSSEAIRQLTTWQFLNCIRLWTKVVCGSPQSDQLGALAFPLSQIIFGIIAALPSIYALPFKYHLISCLHQLAASCQVFIPTASKLCEVLEHADLYSKQTASTEVAPRLQFILKFAPDTVTRATVRDLVVKETISLLQHDAEIYRYHVGFPEYTYLTIRKLRAFAKKAKVSMWRDLGRTLASQLEDAAAVAKQARVSVGKAPMAVTDFEPLLSAAAAAVGTGRAPEAAAQRLAKLTAGRGLQVTLAPTAGVASGKIGKSAPGDGAAGVSSKLTLSKQKTKKEAKASLKKGEVTHDDEEEEERSANTSASKNLTGKPNGARDSSADGVAIKKKAKKAVKAAGGSVKVTLRPQDNDSGARDDDIVVDGVDWM